MDKDAILQLIQNRIPTLTAVYGFGSRVVGGAGVESDLDLAVLVDAGVDPLELWSLAGDIAAVCGCPVDLLDLRAASTVMQYQVITTGERWWNRGGDADLYESFILSEKTNLDEARAGLISDILEEGRVYGR